MSMHTNLKDVGWMCHVTPIKTKKEPAYMPPISQIPNIGCMPDQAFPKCDPPSIYKSTDTPFIRMAKMGGRPDLLCFRENEPNRGSPVPYCRCDWFYLEDNAQDNLLNATPKEKHCFKVPSYMTHMEEFKPKEPVTKSIVNCTPPDMPVQRKPKKCGKLPPHRPGYADYNRKPTKVGIAYYPVVRSEPIRFPKRQVVECEETTMPKLLANSYRSDYDQYRKQWGEIQNFHRDSNCCVQKFDTRKVKKRPPGPIGNDVQYGG